MDTSSAAAECVTLQAAAGFVVHLFPTGQGNVIGNPIEPVIKLTANPKTARTMKEHIDLDVCGILRRDMTPRSSRRPTHRYYDPHLQRPPHLRRSARPPRIRADQVVSVRIADHTWPARVPRSITRCLAIKAK